MVNRMEQKWHISDTKNRPNFDGHEEESSIPRCPPGFERKETDPEGVM